VKLDIIGVLEKRVGKFTDKVLGAGKGEAQRSGYERKEVQTGASLHEKILDQRIGKFGETVG